MSVARALPSGLLALDVLAGDADVDIDDVGA